MPSIPMQDKPKTTLIPNDIKNQEEVKFDHDKVKTEQKLKHIMSEYGCGNLWSREGLVDALHHIYHLGKEELEDKETNAPMTTTPIHTESTVNEYAPGDLDTNGGPSATAPILDKHARDILDGAITACAMQSTADGRVNALQSYCNKHGVDYQKIYNLISMETGPDYFVKDEVPGSEDTNESLIKSYKSFLNKIKK